MSKKRKKRRQRAAEPWPPITPKSPSKGKDYRSQRYIPYIFRAEVGIYESSVMAPELTDAEVVRALQTMIRQLRAGKKVAFGEDIVGADDLIAWRISQNWEQLPQLSNADLAGCLNEVLQSAQTRSQMHRDSRGYLKYLEKFMRKAGVKVQRIPASELEGWDEWEKVDFEAMSLAEIGELWLKKPEIWDVDVAFENRAAAMSRQGQAQEVIALCQKLLKRAKTPDIRANLYNIAGEAYYRSGDYQQAVAMQQAALKENPDLVGALSDMAEAYRAMGQPQKAIETWEEELRIVPSNLHCYREIAATYREMGDLTSEEATWRRLLADRRLRPGLVGRLFGRGARNITVLVELADCLRRQGRAQEAEAMGDRIQRTMPDFRASADDWVHWTRYQLQAGQGRRAFDALEKLELRAIGPVRWEPAVQAAVLDVLGERDEAARRWKQVARLLAGKPWQWPLTLTRNILGDLLPPDSGLFQYVKPEESAFLTYDRLQI